MDDLAPEVVDQVVKKWVDVLTIPSILEGQFIHDNDESFFITTKWSYVDAGFSRKRNYQTKFIVKHGLVWSDHGNLDCNRPLIKDMGKDFIEDFTCLSRDSKTKAIVTTLSKKKKDISGMEKEEKHVCLTVCGAEFRSYDLTELDKHGAVYTSGEFGSTMAWNESLDKLAYLAEKKLPTPKPFFPSSVEKCDKDNNKNEDSSQRGEEYALRQGWGEQMNNFKYSVIVILDLKTDKFSVIDMPPDQFPTDIQWVQNSAIIGTSYKIPDWRLGLIYCTNRESRIFHINADGTDLSFLSASGRASFCPRVKPDGTFVIWQERAVDEPHNRARNIMGVVINSGKVESPICVYDSAQSPNLPIYDNFPKNCWARDGKNFFALIPIDGVTSLMSICPISSGGFESKLIVSTSPGVDNILWIGENHLMLSRSSMLITPYIELVEVSGENRRVQITKGEPTVPDNAYSISKLNGQASIPSFFVGPDNFLPSSVPLIVWVHGGPHSCFVDSFIHESTLLMRLGYAFLKVNYIGSVGANKRDETGDLLGKIGFLDVDDSQNIVEKALKAYPCVNPKQVGVWGGSHGGFLTCHLISQFPDFYKAAVARNPVCDLNVMMGTSDITDWIYAELGFPFPANPSEAFVPAAKSAEEVVRCFKASPISHVSKVKAPTLLCVGSEDLRVPMSQGLSFYRALKAYGVTTEVRVYPDCHPLSSVPVRIDNVIQAALWFKKFIK